VDDAVARYRAASEANDIDALMATLAPEAELVSPISGHMVFKGHDDVRVLLTAVHASIANLRWREEVGSGRLRVILGDATVGPLPLGDAMVLELAEDGRIRHIRPHLRPWPALTLLALRLGLRISRHPALVRRALQSAPAPHDERGVPALPRRTLREQVAAGPPERIADGVWLIRGGPLRTMNVYLIEEPAGDGVTVFDAGEKGMAGAIEAAAAPLGGIRRVVLGHADNDHRGAAPALARHAPVHCHPTEVDAAQRAGHRDYWDQRKLPLAVRTLHRLLMRYAWDGGPTPIAGTIREGDAVAGFRVVELPGHAPGLIGLFREADGLALVSDCVYMTSMWGRPQPAAVPLDAYNLDTAQARESVRKLAALRPRAVWPGHRGPLAGPGVVAELERAAAAA
jgi:glyoxylase-like metal-dependent hydrolase (beta-lactamase superfamily II)